MLYVSIIFISFFSLFNGFFIGKLIKRKNISVNNYIATVEGFIIFVSGIYLLYILLYLVTSTIVFYIVFLAIIQIVLLSLYIWNWRFTFISFKFNIKPIGALIGGVLTSVTLAALMICFVFYKNGVSINIDNWTQNVHDRICNNEFGWFTQINLNGTNSLDKFSFLTVNAVIFTVLFDLPKDSGLIYNFLFWQQVVIYCIILSCSSIGIFYKQICTSKRGFYITVILLQTLILAIASMFYESPFAGEAWAPIILVSYCYIMFTHRYLSISNRNLLLSTLIIFCLSLHQHLIAISGALIIFTFFYDSFKPKNAVGTLIILLPSFMFSIFVWLKFTILGLQIFLISLMVIINFFLVVYYRYWYDNLLLKRINKFISNYIILFFILVLSVIYLSSIFCTVTIYNYHLNFDIWSYKYIWNIDINNNKFQSVFEIFWWVLFVVLVIIIIVYCIKKKKHIGDLSYTALSTFVLLVFINPLSLNLWTRMMQHGTNFDLNVLNFIVIVPLFISLANVLGKSDYFAIKKSGYFHE